MHNCYYSEYFMEMSMCAYMYVLHRSKRFYAVFKVFLCTGI